MPGNVNLYSKFYLYQNIYITHKRQKPDLETDRQTEGIKTDWQSDKETETQKDREAVQRYGQVETNWEIEVTYCLYIKLLCCQPEVGIANLSSELKIINLIERKRDLFIESFFYRFINKVYLMLRKRQNDQRW